MIAPSLSSIKEAMIGFEPMKDGFADRCLRPLGHIAGKRDKLLTQVELHCQDRFLVLTKFTMV